MRFVNLLIPFSLVSLLSLNGLVVFGAMTPVKADFQGSAVTTKRSLVQGDIIGTLEENGTHVWRSIPYGADTSGQNRWRAPQPVTPWEGTREFIEFGPRCPQTANIFNEIEGAEHGDLVGSEDCLSVDVYAPSDVNIEDTDKDTDKDTNNGLPVMVWIHGGSNVSGSSQIYKAHNLVRNEKIIVIGAQYRLGPLGFFAHPELAEDGANFAILDLIAALKWVKQNASRFGGNPDNVTIFGESAGGHNVVSLLAAPAAKNLFHRAIIQSGSFDSVALAEARGESGSAVNSGLKIASKLGAKTADALRAVPFSELFAAYDIGTGFTELPTIIQDGKVLPATPLREAFSSRETFHTVPIMSGTNRDEMKLFQLGNPALTRKLFGTFYQARNQKLYDTGSDYSSRVWRIRSVDGPLERMQKAGHDSIYGYRFDWDDGGAVLFTDLSKILGAAHAMEIPFVFNRFVLLGDSQTMGAYWASSFARSGVPSAVGAPSWPKYGTDGGRLLRLDAVRRKKDRGIETIAGGDTIDKLVTDLRQEKRVNQKKRCRIAKGIVNWVPSLEERVGAAICDANGR